MHARAQARVADQVFGVGETRQRPNRRQDGHRRQQRHAGDLHQQRDALIPRHRLAHLGFQRELLPLGELQGGQVGLDAHLLER